VASAVNAGARSSTLVRVAQSNTATKVVVAAIDRQMEEDSTAFAVSRDGRCFLLAFQARMDSDLFLVKRFSLSRRSKQPERCS
jgi:hypothetical protein